MYTRPATFRIKVPLDHEQRVAGHGKEQAALTKLLQIFRKAFTQRRAGFEFMGKNNNGLDIIISMIFKLSAVISGL